MIFYFSGTGNSAWVANLLAEAFEDKIVNIAKAITNKEFKYSIQTDEKVGFVFPVYSWGPPKIVLEFVKNMDIENSDYIYFICTCGDDTGYTAEIFSKALVQRGMKCNAGYSVQMPNVYVAFPGFDIDEDIVERNKVSGARERIKYIISELKENVNMRTYQCHKGSFPFLKSYVIYNIFNKSISAKPFFATDACIGCKKCEHKCPVGNIKVEGKPIWGDNCTQCSECFHVCPVNAVQYGKFTKHKHQYKGKYLK